MSYSYGSSGSTNTSSTNTASTTTTATNNVEYTTTTSTTSGNNSTSSASSSVVPSTSTVTDESLLPDDAQVGDRVTIDSRVYEFTTNGWAVISEGNFLRFPSNPEPLDRYAIANKTWEYDGTKWILVYVGAVEDQDDYVKKVTVEHTQYFGSEVTDIEPTPHDLYGKEIDDILTMLNHGPATYTGNNSVVIRTGRDQLTSDSGGVIGTNFQAVNISLDLRELTSVAEIDIKEISISGRTIVDIGTQATYAALLTGRPSNVGYNWIITEKTGDSYVPTSPLRAGIVGPTNRSYAEVLIREEGTYRLEVKALIKRSNNEGIIVIDNELDTNIEIDAQEVLPDYNDTPNAQRLSCFLNPDRAEANGGYQFFKRAVSFTNDNGEASTVPIINFMNSTVIGNGLHFVFTGLEDAQPTPNDPLNYEGYLFVHERLMEDRLKWSTKTHTETNEFFSLSDVSTLLIGPGQTDGGVSFGVMKASSKFEGDSTAYPPYFGISAYNYRGYAIVDPFQNVQSSVQQAVNVSVNSRVSPEPPAPLDHPIREIQYINKNSSSITPDVTNDITKAVSLQSTAETKILEFGNSIANGVLSERFVRGYIQPTREVINNTAVVRNHFIKDKDSKYFVCNARAEKPTTFLDIYMYDLWIEEDFDMSLAGSSKFTAADVIDPKYLNYYPTNPVT